MRDFLKDILTQHRAERNGAFIIVLGIAIVVLVGIFHQNFASSVEYEHDSFKAEIATFLESQEVQESQYSESKSKKSRQNKKEIVYFKFDPNNLSKEKWMLLGFSEKQASVIKNYESKSNGFREKSDLQKLFVISDEKYEDLKPWIDLPDVYLTNSSDPIVEEFTKKNIEVPILEAPSTSFELNSCDTTDLKSLKGIGSYYAKKIVEYRDELGGYRSTDQLSEIWKMREETIEAILPFVFIDTLKIKKININRAEAEDLKSHPYIDWNEANSIVNMRKQNGDYKTIYDIEKSVLIDDKKIEELKYYITIND